MQWCLCLCMKHVFYLLRVSFEEMYNRLLIENAKLTSSPAARGGGGLPNFGVRIKCFGIKMFGKVSSLRICCMTPCHR